MATTPATTQSKPLDDAKLNAPKSVPSNTDFATEVKTDRLRLLYRVTVFGALAVLLFVLTFGASRTINSEFSVSLGLGVLALLAGCALTHVLLARENLDWAAWAYILGWLAMVGVLMYRGDDLARELLPFVSPILVFIAGLLITPASTFVMGGLATAVIIGAPYLVTGSLSLTPHQIFTVVLMLLSALLSTQVSGELYQVTQWALMNYQRERKTNDELFEKRRELQLSLKRSEVLSETLQEANVELESAKRAAEEAKNFRGQFLANMSHELRTPLNAIIGFSETMLQFPIMYDDEPLPPAYERDLNQIYTSGRQLLHVINDILDLAKVDAGKLEVHFTAVDIVPLIQAAMSTTKGLIGAKPIQLERDIPDDLPKVWADETRLRQVLLNLYSNAAKYTDEGTIRVTVRQLGDELQVAIRDTGIGIPEEYQGKLFQEFQQAGSGGRDPRSGTGLGLAISRQLLMLMGGRIWMESKVAEGSTFYFTVRVYDDQDKKPATLLAEHGEG
jgi:signal transduction histidine kinase